MLMNTATRIPDDLFISTMPDTDGWRMRGYSSAIGADLRPGSQVDLAHLGLGDTDSAMAQLEEGYRSRAILMVIADDPFFSELESDARYRDLMARLRLPIRR